MLKRFPIHRIILFLWNVINYLINGVYTGYDYINQSVFPMNNDTTKYILNLTSDSLNHSEF
jgi:hypothetical protein